MDLVYSNAHVTIIGTRSKVSDSGLPGVGTVLRRSQPQAGSRARQFVSTLPDLREALADSSWMSRGRTFQEGLLSRRCLVFTDYQIYFMCGQTSQCESFITNYRLKSRRANKFPSLWDPEFLFPPEARDPNYFKTRSFQRRLDIGIFLAQYSTRSLTYSSDAINAFRGILARVSWPSYWGIPFLFNEYTNSLARNINLGFAAGLSWEPLQSSALPIRPAVERRSEFPSWSWAGWKGSVRYYETDPRMALRCDRLMCEPRPQETYFYTFFYLEIWVRNGQDQVRLEHHFNKFRQRRMLLPETSPQLIIDSKVIGASIVLKEDSEYPRPPGYYLRIGETISSVPILLCHEPLHEDTEHPLDVSNQYDGIVLFQREKQYFPHPYYFVMLVQPCSEDMNERLGSIWIRQDELNELHKSQKKIVFC